jgi:hypothetical protein
VSSQFFTEVSASALNSSKTFEVKIGSSNRGRITRVFDDIGDFWVKAQCLQLKVKFAKNLLLLILCNAISSVK